MNTVVAKTMLAQVTQTHRQETPTKNRVVIVDELRVTLWNQFEWSAVISTLNPRKGKIIEFGKPPALTVAQMTMELSSLNQIKLAIRELFFHRHRQSQDPYVKVKVQSGIFELTLFTTLDSVECRIFRLLECFFLQEMPSAALIEAVRKYHSLNTPFPSDLPPIHMQVTKENAQLLRWMILARPTLATEHCWYPLIALDQRQIYDPFDYFARSFELAILCTEHLASVKEAIYVVEASQLKTVWNNLVDSIAHLKGILGVRIVVNGGMAFITALLKLDAKLEKEKEFTDSLNRILGTTPKSAFLPKPSFLVTTEYAAGDLSLGRPDSEGSLITLPTLNSFQTALLGPAMTEFHAGKMWFKLGSEALTAPMHKFSMALPNKETIRKAFKFERLEDSFPLVLAQAFVAALKGKIVNAVKVWIEKDNVIVAFNLLPNQLSIHENAWNEIKRETIKNWLFPARLSAISNWFFGLSIEKKEMAVENIKREALSEILDSFEAKLKMCAIMMLGSNFALTFARSWKLHLDGTQGLHFDCPINVKGGNDMLSAVKKWSDTILSMISSFEGTPILAALDSISWAKVKTTNHQLMIRLNNMDDSVMKLLTLAIRLFLPSLGVTQPVTLIAKRNSMRKEDKRSLDDCLKEIGLDLKSSVVFVRLEMQLPSLPPHWTLKISMACRSWLPSSSPIALSSPKQLRQLLLASPDLTLLYAPFSHEEFLKASADGSVHSFVANLKCDDVDAWLPTIIRLTQRPVVGIIFGTPHPVNPLLIPVQFVHVWNTEELNGFLKSSGFDVSVQTTETTKMPIMIPEPEELSNLGGKDGRNPDCMGLCHLYLVDGDGQRVDLFLPNIDKETLKDSLRLQRLHFLRTLGLHFRCSLTTTMVKEVLSTVEIHIDESEYHEMLNALIRTDLLPFTSDLVHIEVYRIDDEQIVVKFAYNQKHFEDWNGPYLRFLEACQRSVILQRNLNVFLEVSKEDIDGKNEVTERLDKWMIMSGGSTQKVDSLDTAISMIKNLAHKQVEILRHKVAQIKRNQKTGKKQKKKKKELPSRDCPSVTFEGIQQGSAPKFLAQMLYFIQDLEDNIGLCLEALESVKVTESPVGITFTITIDAGLINGAVVHFWELLYWFLAFEFMPSEPIKLVVEGDRRPEKKDLNKRIKKDLERIKQSDIYNGNHKLKPLPIGEQARGEGSKVVIKEGYQMAIPSYARPWSWLIGTDGSNLVFSGCYADLAIGIVDIKLAMHAHLVLARPQPTATKVRYSSCRYAEDAFAKLYQDLMPSLLKAENPMFCAVLSCYFQKQKSGTWTVTLAVEGELGDHLHGYLQSFATETVSKEEGHKISIESAQFKLEPIPEVKAEIGQWSMWMKGEVVADAHSITTLTGCWTVMPPIPESGVHVSAVDGFEHRRPLLASAFVEVAISTDGFFVKKSGQIYQSRQRQSIYSPLMAFKVYPDGTKLYFNYNPDPQRLPIIQGWIRRFMAQKMLLERCAGSRVKSAKIWSAGALVEGKVTDSAYLSHELMCLSDFGVPQNIIDLLLVGPERDYDLDDDYGICNPQFENPDNLPLHQVSVSLRSARMTVMSAMWNFIFIHRSIAIKQVEVRKVDKKRNHSRLTWIFTAVNPKDYLELFWLFLQAEAYDLLSPIRFHDMETRFPEVSAQLDQACQQVKYQFYDLEAEAAAKRKAEEEKAYELRRKQWQEAKELAQAPFLHLRMDALRLESASLPPAWHPCIIVHTVWNKYSLRRHYKKDQPITLKEPKDLAPQVFEFLNTRPSALVRQGVRLNEEMEKTAVRVVHACSKAEFVSIWNEYLRNALEGKFWLQDRLVAISCRYEDNQWTVILWFKPDTERKYLDVYQVMDDFFYLQQNPI